MAAIAALFGALWPGLLGAVMTGFLIYLSLLGLGRARSQPSSLQWRAELYASTGQQTGAANRPLGAVR